MSYFGLTLLIILAGLMVYSASLVTYHVSRSGSLEVAQKRAIYLLVWFIPLIGPAITVVALGDDFAQQKKKHAMPLLSYIFLAGVFSPAQNSNDESGNGSGIDTSGGSDGDF